MARFEVDEKQRYFIRIPRGVCFTTHCLVTSCVERLKHAGVEIGALVPDFLLQQMDANLECFPPCGSFKGQLQFRALDFLKVTRPPRAKEKRKRRKKAAAATAAYLHLQLCLEEKGILSAEPASLKKGAAEVVPAFIVPEIESKAGPVRAVKRATQLDLFSPEK